MNVRCPTCQTVFRVDPEKIPASGIRARCSRCNAAFRIEPPSAREHAVVQPLAAAQAAPAQPASPPPPASAPPAPAMAAPPPADATHTAPSPAPAAAEPAQAPATALAAAVAPAPAVEAAPATAAAPAVGAAPPAPRRPSFRNQDPASRAQRIARALVSDIVAYNKDRLQQSITAGTLRTDFREEIRKSWEEYVGQVGLEMAKTTPYFRDSLNEILAKGQKLF